VNLLIRPAIPADIPTMMALERHAATAAHWSALQHHAALDAPGPRRLALVIEEDSEVCGFLVARVVDQEWEIENLAVARTARRRGLGTRLLGEFLGQVRDEGAEAVFLEVRESNRAARLLYEKWAFVETGRRHQYYQEPQEDAIRYRLDFTCVALNRVH
jgi:ribosomal-protein-alanine N-acetyltransferase